MTFTGSVTRAILCAVCMGGALLLGPTVADAQQKGAKSAKLYLVEAICETSPAMGEKCNPTTFLDGRADLRTQKQPQLYTSPTFLKAGTVKLRAVTPPPGADIFCEMSATTTFGADPEDNCILAGLHVEGPAANGTIPCKGGYCAGEIFAVASLPDGGCTNTKMTVERLQLACWLTSAKLDTEKIAQNGLVVLPGVDCESGC
jgi:hypothetical protein